ncbi:MAG: hypothetical protein GY777_18245, partial [Candidatus Brocadiaceae bacterium]|nr:hypothetical protein [Candidatus Brocadiaceae bacterium]
MNDSKIKQIRKMPAGNDMIVLWIGLLCLGMRSGRSGIVELGDNIPYDSDMLSVEFDIEKRTVELALTIFQKFNMIEVFENGSILLCNFEKHQELEKIEKAKESQRERTRKFRENKRQKALPSNKNADLSEGVTVTSLLPNGDTTKCNGTDIDVDKEKDKTKNNTKKKKEKNNAVASCPLLNIPEVKSAWDEWMKVRASKKASNSQQAISRAVNSLVKFSDNKKDVAIQILNNSSDGGWTKLYELKPKYSQQSIFK